MNPELHDEILGALWPFGLRSELSVWAVIDCARDPRIYRILTDSCVDFRCLFSGDLPAALEKAAPHLIELAPENDLVTHLLNEGWGQSWGIYLKVRDASQLRRHLRTFLRVQDGSGKRFLFRYYDPRVLRIFLPTCRADELKTLFGPIESILMESDDGNDLLEYRIR